MEIVRMIAVAGWVSWGGTFCMLLIAALMEDIKHKGRCEDGCGKKHFGKQGRAHHVGMPQAQSVNRDDHQHPVTDPRGISSDDGNCGQGVGPDRRKGEIEK